jgi:hypothetical protein
MQQFQHHLQQAEEFSNLSKSDQLQLVSKLKANPVWSAILITAQDIHDTIINTAKGIPIQGLDTAIQRSHFVEAANNIFTLQVQLDALEEELQDNHKEEENL